MKKKITRAAVLGAGVMGANIAAQLVNVGIDTVLLDIVPAGTENIKNKNTPEFRNGIALKGVERAKKSSPPSFYLQLNADLIRIGNIEDDLNLLKDVDIVIEAITEDIFLKRDLYKKIEKIIEPGTIITSNTSGISVNDLCEGFSTGFRQYFAATHFFNPPRYMKLLEIIPGPDTLPEVIETIAENCKQVIGKRIVYAKDTPNFIANRVSVFTTLNNIRWMNRLGLTIEAVDELTGPVIGFSKSATFRTTDIVGVDTLLHVAGNVFNITFENDIRDVFDSPEMIRKMIEKSLLGDKSGSGFYKKDIDSKGARKILVLDFDKMEYRERLPVEYESLSAAVTHYDLAGRLKELYFSKDTAGIFTFRTRSEEFIYAAGRLPEIADDILNIDNAVKWGFNREAGPFEMWDAIGLKESALLMKKSGYVIPAWVNKMLGKGFESFYISKNGRRYFYDIRSEDYTAEPVDQGVILLPSLKEQNKKVAGNNSASLVDIGDGVACLEFHSGMNTLNADIIHMINKSSQILSKDFDGMVIFNHGDNFSVGADLRGILDAAEAGDWEKINLKVKELQDSLMKLKYADKPIVAAPAGKALGAGCEVCLAADRIRYAAETCMGLVEKDAGLIPAGGGLKEMLIRCNERMFDVFPDGLYNNGFEADNSIAEIFETIAFSKTSSSGPEAESLGYLRKTDKMTVNCDFLLSDAKNMVIAMNKEGYEPLKPLEGICIPGKDKLEKLKQLIQKFYEKGFLTEYDVIIAEKIAYVLCGGELSADIKVGEQYLLDLEREAFLSLCGNKKTRERMKYMILTGKSLKN